MNARLFALLAFAPFAALALAENFGGRRGVEVREVNDASGQCEVEPLNGDARVKLVGKVKVLRVGSLHGAAILDASELEAQEIVVAGDINGGTVARLNAPRGTVRIQGDVNGGAALDINAPGGSVTVGGDGAGNVGGGTRVHIAAKDVHLRGAGTGGTHIAVVLSQGGSLKFGRLQEGAHVRWKKSAEGDPAPKVEAGEVLGGASCGEAGQEPDIRPAVQLHRDEAAVHPTTPEQQPMPPIKMIDAEAGPMIAAGIIDARGKRIAAEILALSENEVTYRETDAAGGAVKAPLSGVAVVLFRPLPEARKGLLTGGSAGLILRTGDFVDGELKSLERGSITVSSVVFGLKRFDVGRDVVAVVLRKAEE